MSLLSFYFRNTYTGIAGVDPAVREAGRGMGMTDRELLRLVELPLAAGVILAGIRVATVVSVGVATIGAAIGAGGLGVYIFRGVATVDDTLIDRKSTRLNSSHDQISYAVFCLKKKKKKEKEQ